MLLARQFYRPHFGINAKATKEIILSSGRACLDDISACEDRVQTLHGV
jgi:hypothetical protein